MYSIISNFLTCTDTITLNDHQDVYEKLVGVSSKWHDLGGALGLKYDTLSTIRSNYSDVQERLREMLAKRLQSGSPLTWSNLCGALRNPTVSRADVAAEIEEKLGMQNGAWCYRL